MLQRLFRERRRTRAVSRLGILNTPAEPSFDRFVASAADAFDSPIALLSLIYSDQQWFKAAAGLTIDRMPRKLGFCGHALDRPDLLESCDPLRDPRFCRLPVVTEKPFIRYYIGVPLRLLDGTDVGALCVLDIRARPPASPDQRAYLLGLARQAARALEARGHAYGNLAA